MKIAAMFMLLALAACQGGIVPPVASSDPYVHSEEAAFAAFCAAHPHHGTCP